jgi:hypothetical protein
MQSAMSVDTAHRWLGGDRVGGAHDAARHRALTGAIPGGAESVSALLRAFVKCGIRITAGPRSIGRNVIFDIAGRA